MSADEHEKSLPERMLQFAGQNLRTARQSLLRSHDMVKRNPESSAWKIFLEHDGKDVKMFEEDLGQLKEFYGKENLIS